MTTGTVLVTGAAGGEQGQTGRRVTELLRERGVPVRAMVRTWDERAEYLRSLGAEVVVGDFLDFASIQKVVEGVSTVYFAYPVQEGLLDASVNGGRVHGSSYSVVGQVLTVREIVTSLAHGLDRDVTYQDVSDEFWAEAAGHRINAHAIAHLSKLWANLRNSPREFAVTDTIEQICGATPKTFAEFVAAERHSFTPQPV